MRQLLITRRIGLLVVSGLVFTVLAPVAWAQEARTIEALAARLKTFEDKEAIADVLITYGRALDSRDFKTYASLFSKDGSWSGGLGKVTGGPQAIYDFMTSRIGGGQGNAAARPIGFGSTYHIMSSFEIQRHWRHGHRASRWASCPRARPRHPGGRPVRGHLRARERRLEDSKPASLQRPDRPGRDRRCCRGSPQG